jgi:NADPH:quinone reductase-like Zn-dependent oxidoreductase
MAMTTTATQVETMRAIVRKGHGHPEDVLAVATVPKPELDDESVLVRVRAVGLARADWYTVTLPALILRPMTALIGPKTDRCGTNFAGVAEAVGKDVREIEVGDEVFGGVTGALCEYVLVKKAIARKPASVGFEEAGAVAISGITALQAIRDKGRLQPGQSVLVNGASGGVGTFAVQVARALGAGVVDAVCSARNAQQARELGADRVYDYAREDYTRSGRRYDLILDVAGSQRWSANRRVLEPEGTLVLVGAPKGGRVLGPLGHIVPTFVASRFGRQRCVFFVAQIVCDDVEVLRELLEQGSVRSVVERTYPLEQTVAAMDYVGEGHARSNVVVTI